MINDISFKANTFYLTRIPSEPYRIKKGITVNDYHQQKEKNTSLYNSDITVACL